MHSLPRQHRTLTGRARCTQSRLISLWVFIASPFVYKVKKPVNLGFLDFSTLEKRHHFCRRELELNRRLCPEVYLAVTPFTKALAVFPSTMQLEK